MRKTKMLTVILMMSLTLLSSCSNADVPAYDGQPSAKISISAVDTVGVFNGIIDSEYVEIAMSPEDIVAFRATEVMENLEAISIGDTVVFSYAANDEGRLELSKLKKQD